MKEFSGYGSHKGWKYYPVVIFNTFYGGNIETDLRVIFSMPEDVEKHLMISNFSTPVPGTLIEVLVNYTTTRDKITLNVLGMKKGDSWGVPMILKTGM